MIEGLQTREQRRDEVGTLTGSDFDFGGTRAPESDGIGGVPEDGESVNRPSEARDVGGVSGTSFAEGGCGTDMSDPSRQPGQHSWRRRQARLAPSSAMAHEDASAGAVPPRHAQREEQSGQRTVTRKVLDRVRAAGCARHRHPKASCGTRKSLEEVDASGPMHAVAGYCDAVGDSGRRQLDQTDQDGIEVTQTMHFRLRLGMSTLPKDWADTDAYLARPAGTVVAGVAAKKK